MGGAFAALERQHRAAARGCHARIQPHRWSTVTFFKNPHETARPSIEQEEPRM
jgi:hypothetical protein